MTKNELLILRELFKNEMSRLSRINELSDDNKVKEFIALLGIEYSKDIDIYKTLNDILEAISITKTNGIYVCTGTFYNECITQYQETDYFTRHTDFDSKHAEFREYCDIESLKYVRAFTDSKYMEGDDIYRLTAVFERENIVLNPYNTFINLNGLHNVRFDFFTRSIETDQSQAKKYVINKYHRM